MLLAGVLVHPVPGRAELQPGFAEDQGDFCTNAEAMKVALCPDIQIDGQQGGDRVLKALQRRDFATLDQFYGAWCAGEGRQLDGRWRLGEFEAGLIAYFKTSRDGEVRLNEWAQARPDSVALPFSRAIWWLWQARRMDGDARSLAQAHAARQLRQDMLTRALAAVEEARRAAPDCPAPSARWLEVLAALDVRAPRFAAARDEVLARFPGDESVLREAAASEFRRNSPPGQLEASTWVWVLTGSRGPGYAADAATAYRGAAESATRATRAEEGEGMYARLYGAWMLAAWSSWQLTPRSAWPDWSRLMQGYEDLLARYPASRHLLGEYTGLACQGQDAGLYRRLRQRLGTYVRQVDWPESVEVCDLRHGVPVRRV